MAKLERIVPDATLLGIDLQKQRVNSGLPRTRSGLTTLLERSGVSADQTNTMLIQGDKGIAETRKTLGIPHTFKLSELVSFAESVLVDNDNLTRQDYEEMFEHGLGQRHLRRKLRRDNQVTGRDMEHVIRNQSPQRNRSIIEITSNAIDFSEKDTQVHVELRNDGFSVKDDGKGMSPATIFEKLLIPTVSGSRERGDSIGKFGVGFMTALSHLEEEGDSVKVQTAHEGKGYQVEFIYKEDEVHVQLSQQTDVVQGTKVTITAANFDHLDARELLDTHLDNKRKAHIIEDGELLNNFEKKTIIETGENDRDNTAIIYTPSDEETDETHATFIDMAINGVLVERIALDGLSKPAQFAIDFPYNTSLPESRNAIEFDDTAHKALMSLIDEVAMTQLPMQQQVEIINGLSAVIKTLQLREKVDTKRSNVMQHLEKTLVQPLRDAGMVIIPDNKEYRSFAIPNSVRINEDVPSVDILSVTGIKKCDAFESREYNAYIVELDPDADPIIVKGKRIFIDRSIYERHKATPALLELAINIGHDEMIGAFTPNKEIQKHSYEESFKNLEEQTIEMMLNSRFIHNYNLFQILRIPHTYISPDLTRAFNEYMYTETDTYPADRSWSITDNDEPIEQLRKPQAKLKLDALKEPLQFFSKESLGQLLLLPKDERRDKISNWLREVIQENPWQFVPAQWKIAAEKTNATTFFEKIIDDAIARDKDDGTKPEWLPLILKAMKVEQATDTFDSWRELRDEDPIIASQVKRLIDKEGLFNIVHNGYGLTPAGRIELYANLARTDGTFIEEFDEQVQQKLDHPLVAMGAVRDLFWAALDVRKARYREHTISGISSTEWIKTIVNERPGQTNTVSVDKQIPSEEIIRNSYFLNSRSLIDFSELVPDNQEGQIEHDQRILKEKVHVIANNFGALLGLDEVRTLLENNPGIVSKFLHDDMHDIRWHTSLFSIIHTPDILNNIEGHTMPITPDRLRIVAQTIKERFDPEDLKEKDCADLMAYLKRVMGSGNVAEEDFAFAQNMYIQLGSGNYYNDNIVPQHILHPEIIHTIHESFSNLPDRTLNGFLDFWDAVASPKVTNASLTERLKRSLEIWEDIGTLPQSEYDKTVRQLKSYHTWDRHITYDYEYFRKDIDLRDTPRSIRPYVLHFRKGSIERESGISNNETQTIERETYGYSLSLTDLALAKKLRADVFHEQTANAQDFAAWVTNAVTDKDNFVVRRELIHGIFHQSSTDPYLFIRELIQNSYDAVSHQRKGRNKVMRINEFTTRDNYVLEISDPVGMDFDTVMGYLFVPEASTKKDGKFLGQFGVGFLSIFKDADKVLIKTQKDGRPVEVRVTPVKEQDGTIADLQIEYDFASEAEATNHTVIQKFMPRNISPMQSSFVEDATLRYGTQINADVMRIHFNGNEINDSVKKMATYKEPILGEFTVLSGSENIVTRGGVYFMDMPITWFMKTPPLVTEALLESGFTIDIPRGIPLTRARNDIASKKKYEETIQTVVPYLAVNTFLQYYAEGKVDFSMIPTDYFEKNGVANMGRRHVDEEVLAAAQVINSGERLDGYENFMDPQRLMQLMTVINAVAYGDQKISLRDLAQIIDTDAYFDASVLPISLQERIRQSQATNMWNDRERERFEAAGLEEVQDFILTPEKQHELLENGGEALVNFLSLVSHITYPEIADDVTHTYYYASDRSIAHAYPQMQKKGWNLSSHVVTRLLNSYARLPELTHAEQQKFWSALIEGSTHEDAHLLTNTDHWSDHHNSRFTQRQSEIAKALLKVVDIDALQQQTPAMEVPDISNLLAMLLQLDKSQQEVIEALPKEIVIIEKPKSEDVTPPELSDDETALEEFEIDWAEGADNPDEKKTL